MDEVSVAVENLKKEWDETVSQLQEIIRVIENCGKSGRGTEEANALPRLNGAAQDGLASLRSMQFRLDLLAQQLPTMEEVQSGQALVEIWKEQYHKLHMGLRNANFQAKANIKKAAQQEEVERTASTLATFDESSNVLKKDESEYKGHRSLLSRTRGLLSTMKSQDVIDRIILVLGFLIFAMVVIYVVSKRIGVLTLQRKIVAAIKSGSNVGTEPRYCSTKC